MLTTDLPNIAYPLNATYIYNQINVSRPYWIAFGALPSDPGADYDIAIYEHKPTWSPCAAPECFCTRLANSIAGGGRTDFVVGDFNHNPYQYPWVWTHCYSGTCFGTPSGSVGWRDGNTVAVNAGLTTVDLTAGTSDGGQILSVYDVYLVSGTTYYFNFHAIGDRQTKLCLFANLAAGTYWAGRNAAQWETDQCLTTYTAPVSGYYGLVIVNDAVTPNPASISFGVSTTVPCNCPTLLASDVSQSLPASPGDAHDIVVQSHPYWTAVGVRSAGDWDLTVGDTPSSPPTLGCPTNVLTWSNLLAPTTDVLAGDYNKTLGGGPRDTVTVRVNSYSGAQPSTVQMDGSSSGADIVWENGPHTTGTLYADDVVRSYDVLLDAGTPYTFSLQTCCANQKLLLFGNPTLDLLWQGRPSAIFETSSTATFTPGYAGFYGAVVVKEDANVGGYSLAIGHCRTPFTLAARTPYPWNEITYGTFSQTARSWAAVGVSSEGTDWDLQQYDQSSGLTWPDCFGGPGALSAGSAGTDFVVGDFHWNLLGTQYVRSYQYSSGTAAVGFTEWDPGSGELTVNAAPLTVTMDAQNAHHLWCYDAYLVGGLTYTFEFSRLGSADTRMFLFTNPTSGVYWAPRSAAVFSSTTDQTFTPPQTGFYGVVVALDNFGVGNYTLRVSSGMVSVENTRPHHDALTALSPNPVNGPLRVGFDLANTGELVFELLDAQGRLLDSWNQGAFTSGHWEVTVSPAERRERSLAPGLYFLRMRGGARAVATRKLTVARWSR